MRTLRLMYRFINYGKHALTTAKVPQHNDVYIVEFPKSGVTWLSAILANAALIESGREEVASFISASTYVPDIHVSRRIGTMPYDRPPVRMIKSHAEFNPNYAFVIYLVRHPLDIMKSYYRFNREIGTTTIADFDGFCRSKRRGIPAWKKHVKSWLVGPVSSQVLHLCRYEDLLKDAEAEIQSISQNFGWNISQNAISEAVNRSDVQKMKESEALYKSRNPRHTMTFVRGSNDFEVKEETISYVSSECQEELKLLGYL